MQKAGFCLGFSLLFGVALAIVAEPSIAQVRSETVLHQFAGGNDGAHPGGPVIVDQSGNLYGTTLEGGHACIHQAGCGTVFKLAPDGTETVLHAFSYKDGAGPETLLEDQKGNLYGISGAGSGRGTVFEIAVSGTYTVLHRFADEDHPDSLTADQAGNLYGTTLSGGGFGSCGGGLTCGMVFQVTSSGVYKELYAFRGGSDGGNPTSLIVDTVGNLYGTTRNGGRNGCCGCCGTVFKLAPDGTETTLHAFRVKEGSQPKGLVMDPAGNLYGTTGGGCCGKIFKLAPDGTETMLHAFDGTDGKAPEGSLIRGGKGYLFGTTYLGGPADCGTAFSILPGSALVTPYSFSCGSDGAYPEAGLLRDAQGNLYGTTAEGGSGCDCGTVFVLKKIIQ